MTLALVLVSAPPAAAEFVEDGGYRYLQVSLGGLWNGFFVFLMGIVTVLCGVFLFFVWRKSIRERAAGSVTPEPVEEDDQTVF